VQIALSSVAAILALIKLASTIWLVRQNDAMAVTATARGCLVYYASKITPVLFAAALLALAYVQGDSSRVELWTIMLIVTIIAVVIAVRLRAVGKWYGLAHGIKHMWNRRRR